MSHSRRHSRAQSRANARRALRSPPCRRAALATISVGFWLTSACASDDGADPATIEPRLSAIQTAIFDKSCAMSSCHSAAAHSGDLVLEASQAHAQLVGVAATQGAAKGEGLLRVKAGDPGQSFLLRKCSPDLALTYGAPMPPSDGLDATKRAAISAWISAGAKND